MTITLKAIVILTLTLGCLAFATSSIPSEPLDGVSPPHAVDIDGKSIPESSATQPDKPIIFSKDSRDPRYGVLIREAAFDHAKHHTLTHTLDGQTLTACVECHHTEQPSAPAGKPYLKTFKRTAVLTAEQLQRSNESVKSCRTCHFQNGTPRTAEYPPKSVRYPREYARLIGALESGELTNDNAYHGRCINCHKLARKRDDKLKAPLGCLDCHVNKSATPSPTTSPTSSSTSTPTAATPTPALCPCPGFSPSPSPSATP